MKVSEIKVGDSTIESGHVRLSALVEYLDGEKEEYFFDFPGELRGDVSLSGDPWLVTLLPLAMKLGEDLVIDAPVDRVLLANIYELMHLWCKWFEDFTLIDIKFDVFSKEGDAVPGRKNLLLFSGGVDAFFSLIRHQGDYLYHPGRKIHDICTVWGADIPIRNRKAFQEIRKNNREIAQAFNVGFIDMITNARETRLEGVGFGPRYFGSLFSAFGHALSGRYKSVTISAGGEDYNSFRPWGSHPLCDNFFSSSVMEFHHDGYGFNRVERTKVVAENPLAMKYLRVCYKLGDGRHCFECSKCYRTILTLILLEQTSDFCKNFTLDLKKLSKVYLIGINDEYFKQIRKLAVEKKANDIVRGIDQSLKYTYFRRKLIPLVAYLKQQRGLWRLGNFLESQLVKGSLKYHDFPLEIDRVVQVKRDKYKKKAEIK